MSASRTGPPQRRQVELPHEAFLTALASLDGVGPSRLRWLLSHGSPEEAWERVCRGSLPAPPPRLGIEAGTLASWRAASVGLDPAMCWQRCVRLGVGVVALGGQGYPPALLDDPDPPVVLFHRGDPDVLHAPRVAIIGTRRATGYGTRVATELGRALAAAGVVVVSGLALGIDAAAHRGALSAPAGEVAPPAAVVGGGLDAPCPARNRDVAAQVVRHGVVLSEVPPGVAAAPWRFPVRNRIIAGLAQVTVVVESAAAGGSMHTVREALARDRPVLAVPGPVDAPTSAGTNLLLTEGAHPCLGVQDVLVALGHVVPRGGERAERPEVPADPRPAPSGDAASVLESLGWRPTTAESLAVTCELDFARISAALAWLESQGWVVRTDGWVERVARGTGSIPGRGGSGA